MKYLCVLLLLIIGCSSLSSGPEWKTMAVTWTASGDDGIVGTASEYDGRVAFSRDSLINHWDSCRVITGINLLTPATAGQTELVLINVEILLGDTTYFGLKVGDEVPNWSMISNIVALYWADDVAPISVSDLMVEQI